MRPWYDYPSLSEGATMRDIEELLLDETLIELDNITGRPVIIEGAPLPVMSRAPAPTWIPAVRCEEETAAQRVDVISVLRDTQPREGR